MLEMVVIREEGFVMMHMVRCTIVLNPYALNFPDVPINGSFEAECESAKYRIVCGGGVVVIGIGKVRYICPLSGLSGLSGLSAPSAASPSSSATSAGPPFWVLGFSSLLYEALFGNIFVAILFCVIVVSAVDACGKSRLAPLFGRKDTLGNIGLDGVRISLDPEPFAAQTA